MTGRVPVSTGCMYDSSMLNSASYFIRVLAPSKRWTSKHFTVEVNGIDVGAQRVIMFCAIPKSNIRCLVRKNQTLRNGGLASGVARVEGVEGDEYPQGT